MYTRTWPASLATFVLPLLTCLPLTGTLAQEASLREALSRYPGATSAAPTVDRELAQRLFRRGITYSNLERYEQAIEEFRQAVVADPNFAEAYRNLANLYYFLERFQESKRYYARYIALRLNEQPDTALRTAITTLAELERQDGNFEESVALDIKSIELDPGNDSQVHIMGNTYHNAGATDKAIRITRAGIEAQPDNAYFYRSLGRFLEQQGRLEEALQQYRNAARQDPESDLYASLVENLEARLAR